MPDHDGTPRGERGVPCSYADCQHRFPSEAAMRSHKMSDPEHFYCKRCDIDCEDWAGLVQHKVDKMAPFIEGRKKIRDEKPVHIVCEFCGESFRSFDGRKTHRAMMHPADQDIDCPGCHKKFIRATHMIEHIERDECKLPDGTPGIPRWQLHSSINHKYMVKEIMLGPDVFQNNILASAKGRLDAGQITDGNEAAVDPDQGGVSIKDLLDDDDDAQMGGYRPLEPEYDLIDMWPRNKPSSPKRSAVEWPKLKDEPAKDKDITEDMRGMSTSTAATPRGILKHPKRSVVEENASQASCPWSVSNASQALFPSAKPTPPTGKWGAIYDNREEKNRNILDTQFWNPFHKDYQVDIFFHPVNQAYTCPFNDCEREASYPTKELLEQHFYDTHWIKMFRCPVCFRRYDTVGALMGHVEHTRKCGVKESQKFETFIAEITGGFLTAQSVSQPRIFRTNDNALIKADGEGKQVTGVMKMRFQGALPASATE